MMKKLAILLLITLVPLSFLSCSIIQSLSPELYKHLAPDAKIENISIKQVSMFDIDLRITLSIKNPYPLAIRLSKIESVLKIEGNQLLKPSFPEGIDIQASETSMVPVELNIKFADLIEILKTIGTKEDLNCEIIGKIYLYLPFKIEGVPQDWPFEFSISKKIPAMQPTINIINFKIEQPNIQEIKQSIIDTGMQIKDQAVNSVMTVCSNLLAPAPKIPAPALPEIKPTDIDLKITISFDIELKNKSNAKLIFKNLQYNFFFSGYNLIQGNTIEIQNDNNRSVLQVKNVFSSKALAQAIIDTISKHKASYKITGQSLINLGGVFENFKTVFKFDAGGEFSW